MSPQDVGAAAPAVAIIGMAGRFPGAHDLSALWDNLRGGIESVRSFSDEELRAAGEPPERMHDPAYVRACGQLADVDKFDAAFFGISPRDASVFDPQHRLFLECAWEAFENAGHVGDAIPGPVGVFAACGAAEYLMKNLLPNAQIMESVGAWLVRHNGNDPNFLATRVSYQLDLKGPSMNIQTACSSALVAVHIACQSLLSGECDMALAGGSTISADQNRGYLYKEGEIFSPDGHCRAFDARSAGTVMGNAVGCVLLKRLDDAVRDGDNVLAILRGSAINNDGSDKVGYLAPSVSGQARVIREALAVSGVHPEDVSYVECHGTGTLIGDPIEVTGLTEAFRSFSDKTRFCAIGSLKTNFGHSGEAAGICSLIKTVLALRHRQIPPSLHYEHPNPQIDFANSPFYVNDKLVDWNVPHGKRRIAGVTALGAGGTNVHVLVEETTASRPPAPAPPHQLLVLSAKTATALDEASANLATHLRSHPDIALADVAYTLQVGRKAFAHRRAIVASSCQEASAALQHAGAAAAANPRQESPSVAFMFPGGGAQYARMGAGLYEREPAYREAFDACLSHLDTVTARLVRSHCLADEGDTAAANARLEAPSLGLPALFATEYAVAKLLMSWGIVPSAMIGHSAGEYTAACLAGVMSLRDAVSIVALRGRLFETLPQGGMLSVALSEDEARPFLARGLSFAAINGPSLCVLSGPVSAIGEAQEALVARGVDCTRVHINVAAHSAMLEPILHEFEVFCRSVTFEPPKIPLVSNLTGTWVDGAEITDPAYWVRHLRSTVRFGDGVERLLAKGARALVEVGPGRTLGSLARQQKTKAGTIVQTLRHPQEDASDPSFLLGTVGKLWVAGVAVDAERLCGPGRMRVELPTYPFQRQRYWVDPDADDQPARRATALSKRPDVADWFYGPSWARSATPRPTTPDPTRSTWLLLSDGSRLAERVTAGLRGRGHRVVEVTAGASFASGDDGASYVLPPASRSDYDALARDLRKHGAFPDRVAHFWSLGPRRGRLLPAGRWASAHALRHYDEALARNYFSLIFFAQAFAADTDRLRIFAVSSHMQAVPGDTEIQPEKATLLGACKVIPREWPSVDCASIDVSYPATRAADERTALQLLEELDGEDCRGEVALRGTNRWLRRLDPVRLPPAPAGRTSLRADGVYLITGGLGGIGLTVAEHLAANGRRKLVLVSRTPFPADDAHDEWLASHGANDETSAKIRRIRAMRASGAEVTTATADVTNLEMMRGVVEQVRDRHGAIHGVFHTAGVLQDELIALRAPLPESSVIDVKAKGALVLDAVLSNEKLDLMVLFSSVSSILGLPGQADYTAANAFLDAFANARLIARPHERTVSVNWNAWQEVGMLAKLVQQEKGTNGVVAEPAGGRAAGGHPLLGEIVEQTDHTTVFRASLRMADTWLLSEHVVRGGRPVIPGTGLLEIARAALEHRPEPRVVELRDVVFSAPFALEDGPAGNGARTLQVRIDRREGSFQIYGDSREEVFVTGRAAYVDDEPPQPRDLGAIRARCTTRVPVNGTMVVQHFMDFGPRWGCVRRIDTGPGEALLDLELSPAFTADLDTYRLHPALLDMATGGAQTLLPGFDPKTAFFVPFSYGRLLLRRPLPARVFSHVRVRESGKASAVFDAVLLDETGQEVASIEGFVMRRAGSEFTMSSESGRRAAAPPPAARPQSPGELAIREGMTPAEGLDALDRVLDNPFSPQIVASTVDIHLWLERLDREARSSLPAAEISTGAGATFARPSVSSTFVAPRDPLEQELASMWCAVLGTKEIGVHDDFFELGGQSLVAVRLFHQIGQKYGVELQLATLFQAPTIAQCAEILRQRIGDAKPEAMSAKQGEAVSVDRSAQALRRPNSLVALQRGGDRLPFFCVHGAGGNVLNFRDLSRAMDPKQPFYGLQASGIDGVSRPDESIEAMAQAYVSEVRELQPHGPYLLGGYSGGGLVAFEMAQMLTHAGEEVGVLAFIDTFHPQMPLQRFTTRTRLTRLRSEGLPYVIHRLRTRVGVTWKERVLADLVANDEPVPFDLRDFHLTRNFERAAARYRPLPWAGHATLFRATQVDPLYAVGGPSYGWDRQVLGGVEIVLVPGNHDTLLLGANAEPLVSRLREVLATANRHAASRGANGVPKRSADDIAPSTRSLNADTTPPSKGPPPSKGRTTPLSGP